MRLRACAADIAARAYAADGQRDPCLAALDAAHTALAAVGDPTNQPTCPFLFLRRGDSYLYSGRVSPQNGDSQRTVGYAQQSLAALAPSNVRNIALTNMDLGMAYAQSGEVNEASRLFGDVGEIAARNSWARLIGLVKQGRADLQPWQDSLAVRTLDDRLKSHGVILA